ncbi:MAG: YihY/virulence factor BrkB family protein [Syntrophobacteraceae bacterium]|nr:YihY/virulence factor BrkB family protein [Desulfobacteraceae bacterium]
MIANMWDKFKRVRCTHLAAEAGFWFMYSLFPFLISIVATASTIPRARQSGVITLMRRVLPKAVYDLAEPTVTNVFAGASITFAAGTFLLALWAASRAVMGLIRALNEVYEVEETRPYWKARGIAVLLTATLLIVYLLGFMLLVIGPVISNFLIKHTGWSDSITLLLELSRFGIITLAMITGFSLIYAFAPNHNGFRRPILPGAAVAMLGWFGVSRAFSYYLQNFANFNRLYGSLGAVIILMTWLYLISLMILIGGVVNGEIGRSPRNRHSGR